MEDALNRQLLFRSSKDVRYEDEHFYKEPIVSKSSLRFVTTEVVPSSLGVDFLGQTEAIAKYVEKMCSCGERRMPDRYRLAIDQFRSQESRIRRMLSNSASRDIAMRQMVDLDLNTTFRETAEQAIYRMAGYFAVNRFRLQRSQFVCTRTLSRNTLVRVGFNGDCGIKISFAPPEFSSLDTGVCVSFDGSSPY